MQEQILHLRQQAETELGAVSTAEQLDQFRIRFLARKGLIATLFDGLRNASAADRPALGKPLNELRSHVQSLFDAKAATFSSRPAGKTAVDLTLPGRRGMIGTKHPITQTL